MKIIIYLPSVFWGAGELKMEMGDKPVESILTS
jgi:hypothetical protein